MVSARLAILLTGLFAIGLFVPAADGLGAPSVAPTIDLGQDSTPSDDAVGGANVYSPYGMESPTPLPVLDDKQGHFSQPALPINGPFDELVNRLANEDQLTPARLAGHVADFYADMGFDTPGSSVAFDENASISFSHTLGDINQDGVTDLLFDQYCNNPDQCMPVLGGLVNNPRGFTDAPCAWPHSVVAVSGQDGSELWNVSRLDTNSVGGQYVGCNNEFVVGVIPDAGHNDILLYRYEMTYPITSLGNFFESEILIHHRISLRDGLSGKMVWNQQFDGYFLGDDMLYPMVGYGAMTTWNLLVNPVLQFVRTQGVDYLPADTQTGLTLQGVGFNATTAHTFVSTPYGGSSYTIINSYQPDEWARGVEPLTGKRLWERKTFEPNERIQGRQIPDRTTGPNIPVGNVSVQPLLLQVAPQPDTTCFHDGSKQCRLSGAQFQSRPAPARLSNWYWGYSPCCYDLTGDGVPDLVYTVLESHSTPIYNNEGPYGTTGRIVALDGQSGKTLYERVVEADTGDNYGLTVQHMGDVTGDGIADYFLHERHLTWDYHHDLALISGVDGTSVWNMTVPRELQVLPIGDADKDGAQDFVYLEYTLDISKVFAFRSFNAGLAYTIGNVSFTPIKVRSGATNAVLWEYESFEAPADIFAVFASFRINGLPDFDGDGVGDLVQDDPLFLPDLTKLHRFTYRSGVDGKEIFKFVSMGTFAFPALIGDVTGDGRDDILLLNGDIVDLWGTVYSGNGTAIWSRRIMTTKSSSYASAAPNMRIHPLTVANGTEHGDFLLNFQLRITHVFRSLGFGGGSAQQISPVYPQIVRYGALNGSADWAIPAMWDQNMTIVVDGASPASQLYINAHLYDHQEDRVPAAPLATPIQIVAGTSTFGAAFALSFFLGMRRWKP